jgi:gluconolactonase
MHRLAQVDAHEGPVLLDGALFFTSVPSVPGRSAIKRVDLGDGTVTTLIADANAANGMTSDAGGRLVVCEQGTLTTAAAIAAIDPWTGARTVLTDGWDGCPFNSPNDVCVRSDGTVWFTDPSYGHQQGFRPPPEVDDHVYRFDPATGRTELVAAGLDKPNGLAFSPDERTLYVGDNGAGLLYAIDLPCGERRVLATFAGEHPDGLKVAPDGRILASSVHGVDVLDPRGRRVWRVDLPGAVNFARDGDRILITADTAIWEADLPAPTAPRPATSGTS